MKKDKKLKEQDGGQEGFTVQQRAAGLAISLAQLYQEDIYKSPAAVTFNAGEPGATFFAIEKAINTWNAICVENIATQSNRIILLCRDPGVINQDEEFLKRFQETVMNAQGMEPVFWPIQPGQEGIAWYSFGPWLQQMIDIPEEDERRRVLNMYFGTYPDMDERF